MKKNDLILKYEKKKSEAEGIYSALEKHTSIDDKNRSKAIIQILSMFIEDIKKLDVETVKREQKCGHPKGVCLELIPSNKENCDGCQYWGFSFFD